LNTFEYGVGRQVVGEPYASVQQYCGVPKAAQALLHATTLPVALIT